MPVPGVAKMQGEVLGSGLRVGQSPHQLGGPPAVAILAEETLRHTVAGSLGPFSSASQSREARHFLGAAGSWAEGLWMATGDSLGSVSNGVVYYPLQ